MRLGPLIIDGVILPLISNKCLNEAVAGNNDEAIIGF